MTALLLLLRALEGVALILVWAAVIWLIRLAILKLIGLIDKRKEYWDVEEAQGIAEANRVLAESLSEEVLAQNYIDALKEIGANGNLVVVPEGSSPVVVAGKEE